MDNCNSTPSSPIRVLIVDDSAFFRQTLRNILAQDPGIEVIGGASNGIAAIEEANRLQPDLVTLDIEMPQMDGLTALRQIRRVCPATVLMISNLTVEGSRAAYAALRHGAGDFIAKGGGDYPIDYDQLRRELPAKIYALTQNRKRGAASANGPASDTAASTPRPREFPTFGAGEFDLVLIGSSTGGPPVLENILKKLPANFSPAIVIAQHMPLNFTKIMAERLNALSAITVHHAEHRMTIQRGQAYISPGGLHTRVKRLGAARYALEVSPEPADALYKPSVEELFKSGSDAGGSRVLGIVLTGMGTDGSVAAADLVACGGKLIAQDQESCAVWGMPKAVTTAGLTTAVLNPMEIAQLLAALAH